jgi:glyoxylase-like metal-dependent hydrolase (beta-lactamase superfamily II)
MDFEKNRKLSRVDFGSWTVWSLCDGYFDFDLRLLFDKDPEVIKKVFFKNGLELTENLSTFFQINTYLIKTRDHLLLVDTGCGSTLGSTSGFLCNQIREAGFSPDSITHVLITHLHGDHMGGLIDNEGKRVFPNALLYVPLLDADFWRDPTKKTRVPEFLYYLFDLAKKVLEPYEMNKKLKLINPGDKILPGIEAVAASGHTVGHMGYRFLSDNEELILLGDVLHVVSVQLENLEWEVSVDTDPKQGVISRKKLVKEAAMHSSLVGGGHLPGTGLGYISLEGESFSWKPYTEQ